MREWGSPLLLPRHSHAGHSYSAAARLDPNSFKGRNRPSSVLRRERIGTCPGGVFRRSPSTLRLGCHDVLEKLGQAMSVVHGLSKARRFVGACEPGDFVLQGLFLNRCHEIQRRL